MRNLLGFIAIMALTVDTSSAKGDWARDELVEWMNNFSAESVEFADAFH